MFEQDESEKKLQSKQKKSHLTTIFNIFLGMYIALIKVFASAPFLQHLGFLLF